MYCQELFTKKIMELNEKLKLLRKTEGYTQKEFAKLLKVDETNYQRYEYGKVSPNFKIMQKLANLHPEYSLWLLTGEVDLPNQTAPHIKSNERLEEMA
jgi:transcriptional regulator with XRE-family HTH domain